MLSTLYLTDTYEYIGFLSFQDLVKQYVKGNIDILSEWDEILDLHTLGIIKYPATVKLNHSIPRWTKHKKFSKKAVYVRDLYLCQYCGEALTNKNVTMDHVIPQSKGGGNSWENCVTSCKRCNHYKRNRTPEEAGMKLRGRPGPPGASYSLYEYLKMKEENKHPDWKMYLGL